MSRTVSLQVVVDTEGWLRGRTYVSEGVLVGFVTLKLRGRPVLRYFPFGLNNSAIALVRSALRNHRATNEASSLNAQWPLFFCQSALRNLCGVVSDFSVVHQGREVVLSDFYGCEVDTSVVVEVPWRSWARAVLDFAVTVQRHCPPNKLGVRPRYAPMYRRYRQELGASIVALRRRLKKLG